MLSSLLNRSESIKGAGDNRCDWQQLYHDTKEVDVVDGGEYLINFEG